MGQRSQIYIRYEANMKKYLIAKYFSWNFGERMISRARWGIENILAKIDYDWRYTMESEVKILSRIFDVNFDMHDVVLSTDIIDEWRLLFSDQDFNEYVFKYQDNNDGKLLVDIRKDCVKYAFLNSETDIDCIMNAEQYMEFDFDDWRESEYISDKQKKLCEENIKWIEDHAILMTKEEVEEFLNYEYPESKQHFNR